MLCSVFIFVGITIISASVRGKVTTRYVPTWDSLDARPLPAWYDEAKVGIFIHWGVFSVPSFHSEWFWTNWITKKQKDCVKFMKDNYPPGFTYQDFASQFTAEFFDPNEWAEIFKASGAKYIVLTSKHHEGYALWPSKFSYSWNSMDVGPHKDLIGSLRTAIKNQTDIRFGLYHSLFEWYNRLWLDDKSNNFSTNLFPRIKILPEMTELVNLYQPEIIWSDGEWEASEDYWMSKEFLAWLYNDSPIKETVVVNDRWGHDTLCKHGGFLTCSDRYNPKKLISRKWENAMTLDRLSWGFRRNAKLDDYLSSSDLIKELVTTVSCGGNLLVNIGPTKEGTIAPIFHERLKNMGDWLGINGGAIYKSKPWTHCQNETRDNIEIWYTTDKNNLYAILLKWPSSGKISLECPRVTNGTNITMLGVNRSLQWNHNRLLTITLPNKSETKNDYAWTLKITNGDGYSGKPKLENNVYDVRRLK